MSISHVGAATGTTTATVPAHNVGDLIIIFAYRSGSTTAPSLGAGFQNIRTQAGTTCSARIGFRIATSTSDTSGTWTNASHLTCLVYRSSNYSTGSSLFIGGSASTSSTTTTVNYPALTMTHADNTSWAIGFAGTSVATAALSTHAPTGMTFFTGSDVTATTEVCAFDTNGTVSSWSLTGTTVSAAGNSVSATVELIENQPGTTTNKFVQHISSSVAAIFGVNGNTYDNFTFNFDPSLAGNGFVVTVCYPSGATPAISDNKGNTWPASGAAGTVTADSGAGNMALQAFVLASATTGTSQIIVSFGGNPQGQVKVWITQLFGVTGTLEGSSTATAVNAGGIISPGSFTPSTSNCLVLSYMACSAQSGTTPLLIVPESGYQLNDADISITTDGLPNASQFALQTTATATNARFYLNSTVTTTTYNVLSFALSTGTQGTLPSTGAGNAPWINRMCYFSDSSAGSPTSWLLQTPSTGNCMLFTSFLTQGGGLNWTAVSDSDGVSWTAEVPVTGGSSGFIRTNIASGNSSRTTKITVSTANQNLQVVYYDIANTDTSPIVTTAGTASNTQQNVTQTSADQPSISPGTNTNCLTVAYMQMGNGPMQGVVAPSGAVMDLPYAYTWQGLASVSGTTWTQGTTTWGSNGSSASSTFPVHDITTPSEFVAGVSITGAGPTNFTLSNSGATVTNDTMRLGFDDGNSMAWGNCAAHYYNGNSTATQNWQWNITNTPPAIGNSVSSFAIILKGPPAAAANPELNFDFPNPYSTSWYRSWELNPITLRPIPPFVNRNSDWPNPPPTYWYREWTQNPLTLRAFVPTPFVNQDWPNPIGFYRPDVSWLEIGNNLPPAPFTFPFNQYDWPSPKGNIRPDEFYSFTNILVISQQPASVFNQYNWPNPPPIVWYQHWQSFFPDLQFQPASVFNNYDYPNPLPVTWYRDYSLNLQESTLKPTFQSPFNQFYWPVPIGNPRPDEFYSFNNIEIISRQPASVYNNYDYPNPYPVKWYQNHTFFEPQITQQPASAFNNYDWQLPYPVEWYESWLQALAIYGPVNLQPFNQTDWPNPTTYPPIDQSFWQNIINLFPPPPPPPPPEITSSGRTWTREEWTKKLTQYVQQRQKLLTFSDMGKMGGRPRKS